MRKNLSIKSVCAFCILLLASCSNDNESKDTIPDQKSILIKKITETVYYSTESETSTSEFVYEKNILKSVTSGTGNKSEFEYSGDKITKINYFKNGIASGFMTFNYTGDLLSSTLSGADQDEKTEYFYSNGNLVSEISGYFDNDTYIVQNETSYTFDQAKNITEEIKTSSLFGSPTTSKNKYFYDTKHHPMKFMNKYYRLVFELEGFDGKSANNVISRENYYPVTAETPTYFTYEILYNDDNFPIEIKKIAKQNNSLISKTVIEYQ
jgi:uncharacterized protein YkuJ